MSNRKGLKRLSVVILAIFFFSTASAAVTVTPENPDNITLNPDDSTTQSFDITFESGDDQVEVIRASTGDFQVFHDSQSTFTSDGQYSAVIQAPDKGNYSQDIVFEFTVASGNNTSTLTRTVHTSTKIPYTNLMPKDYEGGKWMNESFQLDVDGEQYNITGIKTSTVFLGNMSEGIDKEGSITVNNVRLSVLDMVPENYAKILAESKDSEASFDWKVQSPESTPDQCSFEVDQKSIQLKRDQQYTFYVQNSITGERVPNAQVDIYDTKQLLKSMNADSEGKVIFSVPPKAQEYLQIIINNDDPDCKETTVTKQFGQTREDFQENNPEFQLEMDLDNTTVYDTITGLVRNKEGEYPGDTNNYIEITKPSGQNTEVQFNETGFSYKPDSEGTYRVKATKIGYMPSDTVNVEYIPDQDGDGVPNSQDNCPGTEGVSANNGCPREDVEFQVIDQETNSFPEDGVLRPGKSYEIRLVNDTGSTVSFSGDVNVAGGNATVPFDDGVARGVEIEDIGSYTLELEGHNAYSNTTRRLTVENAGFLASTEDIPMLPLAGLLVLAGIGLVLYLSSGSSSGKRRTGIPDDVDYELG